MKTKRNIKRQIFDLILIVLGSVLLAFSTAEFLTNLSIVSGGLAGVGIIIQHFVSNGLIIDIVVAIGEVVLWLVGLFFVGKKFALKTLIPSILFPAFLSLFLRVPVFQDFAKQVAGEGTAGNLLLCAIFAGILNGVALSLTFLGGGSTGGFDSIIFLCEKYLHIKQSIGSFICDGAIILAAIISMSDQVINSLCGIITASLTALIIEFIFIKSKSSYQADILSSHWEEISQYVQDDLGRGATLIPAKGGYHHTDKTILRVVIDKSQYDMLRDYIYEVDNKAFVTFTETKAVFGEGFKKHTKISKINKDLHK